MVMAAIPLLSLCRDEVQRKYLVRKRRSEREK